LTYNQLQESTLLDDAACHGAGLELPNALAAEARRLGDPVEPIAAVADDLVGLSQLAMGERTSSDLAVPKRIRERTGPSPIGSWEMLLYIMPLLPLRNDDSLAWSARLAGYIASRIASPRWQLQADSWRVAR